MKWSDWIALGSAVVALVSLGFSLWGYFVYDKPIKRLQKLDLEEASLKKKQATLKIEYYSESGNSMLRVANVGQANATNLSIKGLSPELAFYSEDKSNMHIIGTLRPQDVPQKIKLCYRRKQLTVEAAWDDESGKGRTEIFNLNCDARS